VAAVEADEVRAADRAHRVEVTVALLEEDDVLGTAGPERLHEPAALGELLGERRGHARVGGGDEDRVEGRALGKPLAPVSDEDMDVLVAGQRRAGGLGEIGEALDAEHLAREPRKQRRLPAVAGAHLEHALVAS
jgi:hypothetical protein